MAHTGRRNADTALVAALAAGKTQSEAADMAGVAIRTVARRASEPAFRKQVLAARAALIERTTGKLSDATLRAAETLLDLLDDESSSVRLGAARALLDTARRYIEAGDMAERIAALEEAVRQHQPALQALEGGKQSA